MPLYEYLCQSCGHRFERIQKFSDPHVTECPTCGGAVEKLMSSPAIQFKGSGWYINDYARAGKSDPKSDSPPKASGTDGSKDTASTTESKADKPAAAAPAAPAASSTPPADKK
jgi:putative FmdB family regulatory protein